MLRLFTCFLFVVASLPAASVTAISFPFVSWSSWTAQVTADSSFDSMRIGFAVAPASCTGAAASFEQVMPYGTGAGAFNFLPTSGKQPSTTYNVCPQILVSGAWKGGVTGTVTTYSKPARGAYMPTRAATVNTAYPSDIVNNVAVDTYSPTCANFYSTMTTAVANQATRNSIINLPVGAASTCTGTVYLDQTPPDVIAQPSSSINSDGSMTRTGHGWKNGQALIFTRRDYSSDVPTGIVQTDYHGPDGRLYYVVVRDANSVYIYDQPIEKGGQKIFLGANGAGSFNLTPYPRQLKNIIVRTATPDNQFAAPGTALGGLAWLPKMTWLTNPVANHCKTCPPTLSFIDSNQDGRRQPLLAKIRFVGIAFTVADDPISYTTSNPDSWNYMLPLESTMQDIIVDRCAFFAPSFQQRIYTTLNFQGVNTAVVNSYFDKTLAYFHGVNTGDVYLNGNSTNQFVVDAATYTAGVYSTTLTKPIFVTLNGGPSVARRWVVGFPMSTSKVLQVYVPTGVTGSCTGGSCNFVTRDVPTGGECDSLTIAEWPVNSQGRPSIRMVGCGEIQPNNTISYITDADAGIDPASYAYVEGSQTFQGSYGPGPLTFRNNDLYLNGNPFHMADDGGGNSYKYDYWLYRNRWRPYWGGMVGSVDSDGNDYGNRHQAMEWKGGDRVTVEGNQFFGNFNDRSQASVGDIMVFRNENQGMNNLLITDNFFQHVAGGFLLNDLNLQYASPDSNFGPTGTNAAVINNVMLDVNQMGPDNGCTKPLGCLPGNTGTYASTNFDFFGGVGSGEGWMMQGPTLAEGLLFENNSFPDFRGSIPDLFFTSDSSPDSGLVLRNNFLGLTSGGFANGLGARPSDGSGPPGCSGGGFHYAICAFPGAVIQGNVFLSQTNSQASINADGWGAGNTVPSNPANLTAIWPKYLIQDWHTNLDINMMRQTAYPGVGADIGRLKSVMGYVEQTSAAFDPFNNLVVNFLAPDNVACPIDVAAPGALYTSFTRTFSDTGGVRIRSVVVPAANFPSLNASYDIRINCEVQQPTLTVRSNPAIKSVPVPAPLVTLAPTSLAFGNQASGSSSAARVVTLTNSGTASLTISSITISGNFSQTNTCGSTLAVNANCTISVIFSPLSVAALTGTLSIADNASGSPHTVPLTGTGTGNAPAVTLSPTSLAFAARAVNTTSAAQTVTLTNSGTASLTINGISLASTSPLTPSVVQSAKATIAAAGNLAATFTTAPVAGRSIVAAFTCWMPNVPGCAASSVTDNNLNTFTPLGPAVTYVAGEASTQMFCATANTIGSSETVTAHVSNTGGDSTILIAELANTTCTVDQIGSGSGSGGTVFTSSTMPTTTNGNDLLLAATGSEATGAQNTAGSGWTLVIQNASTSAGEQSALESKVVSATGAYNATLSVASSATTWAMQVVALKGTTTAATHYAQTNTCGATLAAAATCNISVTFTPLTVGSLPGTLSVTDNASGSPHTAALSGTGQ